MTFTQRFLDDINVNFPNNWLYRLSDVKKGKGAIPLKAFDDRLKFNTDELGWGIFFSPNGDYALNDDKIRSADVAQNIHCIFVDKDDGVDYDGFFMYEPSITIKTKRGHHYYWLLRDSVSYKTRAIDYKKIMEFICKEYQSDVAAKDIARIMRLPGSLHLKDPMNPFYVDVVDYHPERKYDFDDFLVFAELDKKYEPKKEKNRWAIERAYDSAYENINSIDVIDVLQMLGGYSLRGQSSIDVGGNKTDGYKYRKSGNYVHSFSGDHGGTRPSGGPFSIVKMIKRFSNKEVFSWFDEYFNVKPRTKDVLIQPQVKVIKEEVEILGEFGDVIARGDESIDLGSKTLILSYKDERVIIETDASTTQILDAYMKVVGYYQTSKMKHYILECRKIKKSFYVDLCGLSSANELEKQLAVYGITYRGSKPIAKDLISYIHSTDVEYGYIDTAGIIDGIQIFEAGKYIITHKKKKYFCDIGESAKGINTERENLVINPKLIVTETEFKQNIINFVKAHEEKSTATIFTAIAMGMFTHKIRNFNKNDKSMSHLSISGMPGAGKTQTIHRAMYMLGLSSKLEIQASSSKFAMDCMLKNCLPIKLAEFSNVGMKFDFNGFLKNNYDAAGTSRGTAKQEIIEYPNNAFLIVDGEVRSMDTAVYERSISVYLSERGKNDISKYPVSPIINYFLDNMSLLDDFTIENIRAWEDKIKIVSGDMATRTINGYAKILCFAQCFGFIDIVQKGIYENIVRQHNMKGENKIDKTIRTVVMRINWLNPEIHISKEEIIIDINYDLLKVNPQAVSELSASVLLVNNVFYPDGHHTAEQLCIPLSHFMQNKHLHNLFNRMLNMVFKQKTLSSGDTEELRLYYALQNYAETNGFKDEIFYSEISGEIGVVKKENK